MTAKIVEIITKLKKYQYKRIENFYKLRKKLEKLKPKLIN